jgi:hypothetical protein
MDWGLRKPEAAPSACRAAGARSGHCDAVGAAVWGPDRVRRESRGDAGKQLAKVEQEADERKLAQGDPLPQTIYRALAKWGGCALAPIPLQIAP